MTSLVQHRFRAARSVLPALALALLAAAPEARGQALYTWGSNAYGQIGDGTTTSRPSPTAVAGFVYGIDGVSAGALYSLAIRNGAVYAWGDNSAGELGDGTSTTTSTPVATLVLTSGVTAISANYSHNVAIRNGAAYAWGTNVYGQLGDGTNTNRTSPVAVGGGLTSGVTAISAGGSASGVAFSLAIRNGAAYGWGYNTNGQLGDGTQIQRITPVAVGGGLTTGVTAISAGGYHGLAIKDGAAYAWGFNGRGQIGDNTTTMRTTPVAVGGGLTAGVTAVSAGDLHSLAIKDGVAYAWGENGSAQLRDGTTIQRNSPVAIPGLPTTGIARVGASVSYSMALTTDHRLFAWGYNGSGQYGNGTTTGSLTPVEVVAPSGYYFHTIEVGSAHTVAALMPNAPGVYTAGFNGNGQLGDGTTTNRSSPVAATGMNSGISAVVAGIYHNLAIKNGAVFTWGVNSSGQVGDGTTTQRIAPVAVSVLTSGVTAVAAGGFHSLAVRNGALYAWGYNAGGALGDGTNIQRNSPVAIAGLASGVTAVAGGSDHSLAIRNGAVYGWGGNSYGQVGDGTTTQRFSPVAVSVLTSGVTAISAGLNHNLAIRDGAVYAWGANASGQVGDGTTTQRNSPVSIGGALSSGVTSVSAAGLHSLAIKDGVAYAWGDNSAGQLGNGTTINSPTPAAVPGLPATGILQIAAGAGYSMALTTDHRLFAWGDNQGGQFGNGTTTSSLTPVEVFAPTGFYFASVEAGQSHTAYFLAPIPEPGMVLGLGAAALVAVGSWRKRRMHLLQSS